MHDQEDARADADGLPNLGRWTLTEVAAALAAGGLLRAWMLGRFFQTDGDPLIYGDIAKNLLLRGSYGFSAGVGVEPTLIRLPGYPLFLAACFRLFGIDHYGAACWIQIVLELAGCLLLADVARTIVPRAMGRGAARATLWLAVLCPFTAIYAATPLAEALTLFSIAVALWTAVRFVAHPGWRDALLFTVAVTYVALLRPDGALVAVAFAPALLLALRSTPKRRVAMVVMCGLLALAPFAVWTARNWRVFHVVQPLAPRSATDPGDPVYKGWDAWTRTWCLDFICT
ncbi:MAG: glycosyltransferase family 39 protein [Acidobacteriota bacterium]|nr:glycosyltransferase family 39 protein [Acidobacteriota bacterium]